YDQRALLAGLQAHGYVLGQNLSIEFRSALGQVTPDPFPALAAELVRLGVDLIVTTTEPGVRAAQNASRTIPIVMAGTSTDPVATGLVASLARPGGTVTGVTLGDLAGKRLQLLRDALPGLRSLAAFHGDLNNPFVSQVPGRPVASCPRAPGAAPFQGVGRYVVAGSPLTETRTAVKAFQRDGSINVMLDRADVPPKRGRALGPCSRWDEPLIARFLRA